MGKDNLLEQATIIHSSRHSVGLEITKEGHLLLRVPYGVTRTELEKIVARKENWIRKAQQRVKKEQEGHCPLEIKEGETFLLFGKSCTLHLVAGKGFSVGKDTLYMGNEETRETLIAYFSQLLGQVLQKEVPFYAARMGIPCPVIKLSKAPSRWGYCNYKRELGFSWPLVFCPREVIAYVVVHELCHIRNMSHNKAYWQSVAAVLPDYKEREKWLKVHRKVMDTI